MSRVDDPASFKGGPVNVVCRARFVAPRGMRGRVENCPRSARFYKVPPMQRRPTARTRSRCETRRLRSVSGVLRAGRRSPPRRPRAPSKGYDLGDIQTPRSLAMGGSLAATGVSTVGLYDNPANMALAQVYHLEGLATFSPEARRQSYGAGGRSIPSSTVDTSPGGSAARSTRWTPTASIGAGPTFAAALRTRSAIASRSAPPSARSASRRRPAQGRSGRATRPTAPRRARCSTRSSSTPGRRSRSPRRSASASSAKNLTNPGSGFAPTTLSGASATRCTSSPSKPTGWPISRRGTRPGYRLTLGGEIFLVDHLAIRLGYRYDEGLKTNSLSGGVGYVDQRWGVEGSLRRDITGDNPSTMISLSLRYFVDTMGAVVGRSRARGVLGARVAYLDQRTTLVDQRAASFDQRAALHRQRAPLLGQRATLHVQRAPSLDQRATLHHQRAPLSGQRATLHVQRAPSLDQRATLVDRRAPLLDQRVAWLDLLERLRRRPEANAEVVDACRSAIRGEIGPRRSALRGEVAGWGTSGSASGHESASGPHKCASACVSQGRASSDTSSALPSVIGRPLGAPRRTTISRPVFASSAGRSRS